MNCCETSIERVEAKRTFDVAPIVVDWHDFLINRWNPGVEVTLGFSFRPERADSTGYQYRVSTAGVTGKQRPKLPTAPGITVNDGSAVWTSEAVSDNSLSATITDSTWPTVEGITLSAETVGDLKYWVYASGGTSGEEYTIIQEVTLSTGEEKESGAILPVQDTCP